MSIGGVVIRAVAGAPLLFLAACVTKAPTIAHVHVGHALTAVHVTPEQRGYFLEAETRAEEAREAIRRARAATSRAAARAEVERSIAEVADDEKFGLRHSLSMAINHISFAATSPDATVNVQDWAPIFASQAQRVLERCELVALLGRDYARATDERESTVLLDELQRLVDANVDGEDADGSGIKGDAPGEFGLRQLRENVDSMLAGERPAYRPVDRWYLFNLVLLPNGRWVYDKFSRGGQIEGYK